MEEVDSRTTPGDDAFTDSSGCFMPTRMDFNLYIMTGLCWWWLLRLCQVVYSCRCHVSPLRKIPHCFLGFWNNNNNGGKILVSDYFLMNRTLGSDQEHLYIWKKKTPGKMCLLLSVCLLVYLFIGLFIVWIWPINTNEDALDFLFVLI